MEQSIGLDTVSNARELGGYSIDGRFIPKGKLLRTANLGQISKEDIRRLTEDYRVSDIIDLRMSSEREDIPDVVLPGAKAHFLPVIELEDMGAVEDGALEFGTGDEDKRLETIRKVEEMGALNPELYHLFLLKERGQKAYRQFFRILMDAPKDGAVLWHCTDGKDRTGVAAMLLLSALGADKELIMHDYLLTNTFQAKKIQSIEEKLSSMQIAPDKKRRLIFGMGGVFAEYLLGVMEAIENVYGSMNAYLENALQIKKEERSILRNRYLCCRR